MASCMATSPLTSRLCEVLVAEDEREEECEGGCGYGCRCWAVVVVVV